MSIFGLIPAIAQQEGVDPNLLLRVVSAESGGNASAVSSKGARGPAQLMPGTARDMGVDINDPADNIRGGARYLKQQLDRFGSPELALAAYNAGPGAVIKAGGIPHNKETQNYVGKVMGQGGDFDGSAIFGATAKPQGGPQGEFDGSTIFSAKPTPVPLPPAPTPAHAVPSQGAPDRGPLAQLGAGALETVMSGLGQANSFTPAALVGRLKGLLPSVSVPGLGQVNPGQLIDNSQSVASDALRKGAGTVADAYAGKPQGALSDTMRTVGQFLPAVLAPGTIPQRIANVMVPSAGSEAGGMLFKGTPIEGAARFAGGMLGGMFAPSIADMASGGQSPLAPKPVLRAASTVARAIQRDQMTPEAVLSAAQANPTAPVFQSGGENLTGLAEVANQLPGPSQSIISKAVQQHAGQTADRVLADVGDALGGRGDYFATLDAAQAQRKAAALPYRDQAFSTPLDPAAVQDQVMPLLNRVPQSALNFASKLAQLDGRDPNEIGLITERVPGGGTRDVQVSQPTMETLHYIKKGMDQELDGLRSPVTGRLDVEGNPIAGATSNVRSALGKTMRQISPAYDQFMQTWGDESGQVNALRLGRDVFSSSPEMSFEKLSNVAKDWSPAEQSNYAKGVGEALVSQIRSSKGGVGTMRQLLRSQEFQDRARLAFPDQPSFDDFMSKADQEVQMQARNNRVLGNSRTFGRQAAANDLQAQQGVDPADIAAGALETGLNPLRMTGKAIRIGLKALPRQDRSIIGDPVANATVGNALSNPNDFEKLVQLIQSSNAQRPGLRPTLQGGIMGGLIGSER